MDINKIKELAEKFHAAEIARQLNIKEEKLRYLLKKHNIKPPNGRTKLSKDDQSNIRKLAIEGKSGVQIANQLNISPQIVRKFLRVNKIPFQNGISTPRVSDENNNKIKELALQGFSKTQIQKQTGISRLYIGKYCKNQGIELKKGTFRRYTANDAKAKLNSQMQLTGVESKGFYEVQCKVHSDFIRQRPVFGFYQGCSICNKHSKSNPQTEIKDWLISLGFNPIENFKIERKHIDIYTPELKLGIEYCGLYWHTEDSPEPRNRQYHRNKMIAANQNGIRLITIFEDEWLSRKDQVKGFLLSILDKNIKIHARKCQIKEITNTDASGFYNLYHIQGKATRFAYGLGLFYNEELVGVCTLGYHHRGNAGLVLDRLCFKSGITVVGGASRLLVGLIIYAKTIGCKSIISWSDNRWSEGNVYKKLGFVLDKELPPDYSYVKNRKRFSKQSKKKKNLLREGGVGDTESEIAKSLKYSRIWDCGKKRWKLLL